MSRCCVSQRCGVVPVSSTKRRANVRIDIFARLARSSTARRAPRCSTAHHQRREPRCHVAPDRVVMNWACPPSRCGGNDEPPRHAVRDLGSVVFAHDMETEIDPCGVSRRRENVAVFRIENVGLELNPRRACPDLVDVTPVRRRLPVIEQTGGCENGHAGADRHQPHTARARAEARRAVASAAASRRYASRE